METTIRIGKVKNNIQRIEIPAEYLGKEVEIIIRSQDDLSQDLGSSDFRALELNTRGFIFDREEMNAR